MVPTSCWLLLSLFCLGGAAQHNRNIRHREAPAASSPNTLAPSGNGNIEYRLTRLEVLLAEKLENLRADVRESSRRVQALEWQSNEAHATLESLKADVSRFAQQATQNYPAQQNPGSVLTQRVDNLAKGVQILMTATRGLTSDIGGLKRNVTDLINDTRTVLQSTQHLVSKRYFNDAILDLKHRDVPHRLLSCPTDSSKTSVLPKNCKEVQESGQTHSGIYHVHPEHAAKPLMVFCDLQTRGGGWIVIHNRYDGSQDFYQTWHDYKLGFGNLGGEFWLGLQNIHHLSGFEVNELLVELQDLELQNGTAHYTAFSVGSEAEGFALKVLGGYSGDAGDSLMYHAGSRFSTKDLDQDGWPEGSCAQSHNGAWWYRSCDMTNLNGQYLNGPLPEQYAYQGMYWGEFRGAQYSLMRARMLIRPRQQINPLLINNIFKSQVETLTDATVISEFNED